MQKAIPCVLMRGGTSRGPYFLAEDLPQNIEMRDAVLLAVMGSPDAMQVNGLGGGQPQTSKVAIVSRSAREDCDVDYLFAQVDITQERVDTKPNCGNMLAGVGPFAIEAGLVSASKKETIVRIFNVNTGARIDACVQTPDGRVNYDGDIVIAGVSGASAPIPLTFRDFVGKKTGRLFPTGNPKDKIEGFHVTLIDSAMPMMLLLGSELGLDSNVAVKDASITGELFKLTEPLRLEAGRRMGLGDVSKSVIPKVGILFACNDSNIEVAYLMPWVLHQSLAVTGAISVATACAADGTVANQIANPFQETINIKHPAGIMSLGLEKGDGSLIGAIVMRTARRIFEGRVFVPSKLYKETTI